MDQHLEETYKEFVRSGAELHGADKDRMKEINGRLASLSQNFGNNLLDETNSFELYVSDEKDVVELPKNLVAVAANEAYIKSETLTEDLQIISNLNDGIEIVFDDINTKFCIFLHIIILYFLNF